MKKLFLTLFSMCFLLFTTNSFAYGSYSLSPEHKKMIESCYSNDDKDIGNCEKACRKAFRDSPAARSGCELTRVFNFSSNTKFAPRGEINCNIGKVKVRKYFLCYRIIEHKDTLEYNKDLGRIMLR